MSDTMATQDLVTSLSQHLAESAIDPRSFLTPIALLDREHYRQSVTYGMLRVLADDPSRATAADDARAVLRSLEEHLPLHVKDEEEDLMPLLERRCRGARQFEAMRAQLLKEHDTDQKSGATLMAALRQLAAGEPPTDCAAFTVLARAFAEMQERHLAWENAVLLPMAQHWLTDHDLRAIGRSMAARRGIDYPH